VEGSGHGPFEGAVVRVDETGHVTVLSGARPHGQGHETVLAQVAADQLGLDPAAVTVRTGDTDLLPYGRGSYASRTAVVAGNAVALAAARLRVKILAVAGELLDADPGDLVLADGRVFPVDAPSGGVALGEVAAAAAPGPRCRVPPGAEPGLQEQHYFVPPTATFGSGTHVCAVEVDPETGFVTLLDYATVDECGRMLNPAIVEGQVHGGVAHGIGNALLEETVYDPDGQPLTATYMDYLLPTATDVPPIRVAHQAFPSPRNPLGAKGVGEGGAVASPPAILNAITDALRPLPLRLTQLPLTPPRLLAAIQEASRR
jgi:carbon-monoxide dehydrogenase large subunit